MNQGRYDETTGVWTVGTVQDGATWTLTISAKVVSPDRPNTATIGHADRFDPGPANNSASATVNPRLSPTLTTTVIPTI